ncbi:MAG: hypothetical protein ACE5J9_08840 [Methanosarcinales archaeon]
MANNAIILGLAAVIVIEFIIMVLMNVRIKQLTSELNSLKERVSVTDDELLRLAKDIDEFKKLKI